MLSYASTPAPASWKPRFFTIWTGQAFSLLGSQLVQFALIWHITQLTGSGTSLALAGLMGVLPQALLSPFIGALVDRWSRRMIMIAADGAVALATLVLAILFALGAIQVWHIYALLLVRAIGEGFHLSAFGASMVLIVPKEHLARVQGASHALRGGMDIFAAPLGALLLGLLPIQAILAIDISTALLAISPLLFFSIPRPARASGANEKPSLWQDIVEGLRYVLAWRGLLIVLGMVMLINFLMTPTIALLPLLVTRHFGGGVAQLGWLNAATGAGVIAGGFLLGVWGGFKRRVLTAQLGLIGLGLATAGVGAAPATLFVLALAASAVAGLMTPITNGSYGAMLQSIIPPELQGRVFALIMSAATAIAPIGLLVAGPAADLLGVRTWFWLAGAVCATMGVVGFAIPAVMQIEDNSAEAHLPVNIT
jgi:MFS transporter, DHA3 family, macrolide efflux protein